MVGKIAANYPIDEFKTMKYGSVCSGIEAASVAWEPLGWEAQWYAEIEHFPSAVLAHRFPTVPNLGDMTQLHLTETFNGNSIDLLVGGTPCQSFSVAGLRKGLDDPRGQLMYTFVELAARKRPKWVVWENVPGVLSSNKGADFASFLGLLTGRDIQAPAGGWSNSGCIEGISSAYGVAWTMLDAQDYGVAQRRKRIFVIGYLGDWRPAAAVLFERNRLSGDTAKSRKKREATAADAQGGVGSGSIPRVSGSLDTECGGGKLTHQSVNNGHLVAAWWNGEQTAATLTKQNANGAQRMPDKDNFGAVLEPKAHAFKVRGGSEDNTGEQGGTPGKKAFTIGTSQDQQIAQPIAFKEPCPTITAKMQGSSGWAPYNETDHLVGQPVPFRKSRRAQSTEDYETWVEDEKANTINIFDVGDVRTTQAVVQPNIAPTLTASNNPSRSPQSSEITNQIKAVHQATMAIRRLTPTECERLQGFPDDWTLIPYRNKSADQCPDGPRYKACGNSMAVPVMRWIGERIQMVESISAKT
jgi:DNA (cytosine-5)-methyltransferase 1